MPEVFPDDKKNEDPVITDDETDKKDSATGEGDGSLNEPEIFDGGDGGNNEKDDSFD